MVCILSCQSCLVGIVSVRLHSSGFQGQGPDGQEGPGIAPADGLPQDTDQDHQLQQQLKAVEKERDKAKQQLNRCKA